MKSKEKNSAKKTPSTINKKKCLVLDLDNTLWGGIVGEEGIDGIALDMNPPGSAYIAFQQAILDLYHKGVILAVNSKNNANDALNIIRNHPNMVLKEHHFAAVQINWNDKPVNMKKIARELNIGIDSMVFLDDDPVNRAFMREALPEVETPELPKDPDQYASFLMDLPYFTVTTLTDEDKMRGSMYTTERLRLSVEAKHSSKEEFLSSLGMKIKTFKDDPECVTRLAQMTEKTNQFNMNKMPLSEKDILERINDPKRTVLYISARDKFGDYGVIGFACVQKHGEGKGTIESMLMSCRALTRGIEEAFLYYIINEVNNDNITLIDILFRETNRNKPAQTFLKTYFDSHYILNKKPVLPKWTNIT